MDRDCFQSQSYHKPKHLHYGPYIVLQQIRENAYRLDLCLQIGIDDVVNVNSLNHFETPLVENEVTISHPSELVPDFQPPLLEDRVFNSHSNTTFTQSHTSYLVRGKGQLLAQAW